MNILLRVVAAKHLRLSDLMGTCSHVVAKDRIVTADRWTILLVHLAGLTELSEVRVATKD